LKLRDGMRAGDLWGSGVGGCGSLNQRGELVLGKGLGRDGWCIEVKLPRGMGWKAVAGGEGGFGGDRRVRLVENWGGGVSSKVEGGP